MDLPKPIKFDWNQGNIDKNWIKHSVNYKEAEEVFFNIPLKTFQDITHSQTELRLIALGTTNNNRRLFVVFTIRDKRIRIISARDQDNKEKKLYAK